MRKLVLSILLILCLTPGLHALTAIGVLDKAVGNIQSSPSVSFVISGSSGGQTFSADLTMAKEKFRYKAGKVMDVYYDGVTQWTIDHGAKEISLTQPTVSELAEINPLAFLQSYKKNYNVSLVSESAGSCIVKMTAIRKSSFVRSAEVSISTSTWMPMSVNAVLSNGQKLTIKIVSATKGKTLDISTFRFNTKSVPSYEVIDLR